MSVLQAARTRPGSSQGPRLVVDLDAVAANTRLFARRTAGALMAVVKADGFGHGAVDVARTALAARRLLARASPASTRRSPCAPRVRRAVLSWLNPVGRRLRRGGRRRHRPRRAEPRAPRGGRCGRAPAPGCTCTSTPAWPATAPRPGVGRASAACARRAERRGRLRVVGVMGHLGCADDPADPDNAAGRARFAWGLERARAAGLRPPLRHLAATAATLTDPLSHHTLSRVGAGLVGIDPSGTTTLRPALTLTAPVVGVRRVRAGTPVGYGHTWSAEPAYPPGPAAARVRRRPAAGELRPRRGAAPRPAPTGRRPDLDGPGGRRPRRRPARARRDRGGLRPGCGRASPPSPSGRRGPTPSSTRSSPASARGCSR